MSTWPSTSMRCRSRGAGMPTSMACTATPIVITAIVSSFNTFCKLTWTQNRRSHAYTTATPGGLSLRADRETARAIGTADYVTANLTAEIDAFTQVADTMGRRLSELTPEQRTEVEEASRVLRRARAGRQ